MSIQTLKDVNDAYINGRFHSQRFLKNASVTGDLQWIDWSFASGQPSYDARVGDSNTLTPVVATKNDAIYFPDIEASMERRIASINMRTLASGASQATVSFVLYDLVAIYPLIDGDSTDTQVMDNSANLPRYTTGNGLEAVMINHVAPQVNAADGTMTYTNSDNHQFTIPIRISNVGLNKIVTSIPAVDSVGNFNIPLGNGSRGIKTIDNVTFSVAPGGLYCIYLIKRLATINNIDSFLAGACINNEKDMCVNNAWNMPRVYDGANLGFFMMPNGGGRTVSLYGEITFIWG